MSTKNGTRIGLRVKAVTASQLFILTLLGGWLTGCDKLDDVAIESGGMERTYGLYVPSSYDAAIPSPVIFDFHSSGSDPDKQSAVTRLSSIAKKERALVVRPKGEYQPSGFPTWNADKDPEGADDVQFVLDMITDLQTNYSVDPSRIYAMGFSGGARMTSRLACDLPELFAGFAMVAGLQYPENCATSPALKLVAFHGLDDTYNPYEVTDNAPYYWKLGVEASVSGWASHYGCRSESSEVLTDNITLLTFSECDGDSRIRFYSIRNSGHTWPGNPITTWAGLGTTNMEINATRAIWEFWNLISSDRARNYR